MMTSINRFRHVVALVLVVASGRVFSGEDLIAQIPVGDGPVGVQTTADSMQAVVPLLFPETETDPNLIIVDILDRIVVGELRIGRRLISAVLIPKTALGGNESGNLSLNIYGDQQFAELVDLDTGEVIGTFRVGTRPGGIAVLVPRPGTKGGAVIAAVANGSSGDISIIDVTAGTVTTSEPVGLDPRDVAIHPNARHIYTAVGGTGEVAVVDRNNGQVVARVKVGNDPVDIEISDDGLVAIVTNVTNNTVSVLDTSSPAAPTLRRNTAGGRELPVGVQPSVVAIAPDGDKAYVANSGSAFVSVVDLATVTLDGVLPVQREGAAVATGVSALDVTADGQFLVITDRGNDALLSLYDRLALNLDPPPKIDIPGEPAVDVLLTTDVGFACPGFFITSIALQDGAKDGFFATEILTTSGARLLQGGLNLGAAFGADSRTPGFAAFNIANRAGEMQQVEIGVDIEPLDPADGGVSATLDLIDGQGNLVVPTATGDSRLELSATVAPGFYRVRVRSTSGSPAGTFAMAMTTRFVDRAGGGFQGGVNVGGLLAREPDGDSTTGFASFCIAKTQIVKFNTAGEISSGPTGAGALVLTIRDRNRSVVRRVVNSVPPAPLAVAPDAPSLDGITGAIYVDAAASSGGNGTQSRPFRSITQAVGQAAGTGDTIIVRPGVYSPSMTGETLPIGSPGAGLNRIPDGVTLLGSGAESTIIDAENFENNGANVNAVVIGGNNVRFAGFTVRDASAAGVFVINADGVQIDSNLFTGNARFGLGALESDGILVHDNVAVANNETGIAVSAASSVAASSLQRDVPTECPDNFGACIVNNVTNDHRADGILATQGGNYFVASNQCYNNGVSGIEFNNGSPPGQPAFPPLTGTINGNTTIGNGGVQFAFSGTGILVTEFASAVEINDNIVVNNRPGGIAVFEDSSAQRVMRNTVRDNAQNGLVVQKRAEVTRISENVIDNNGLTGLFIDDDSRVEQIANNEVNANGSCLECNAARAGLAVLGGSTVEGFTANNLNANTVGFEINNLSRVGMFEASPIEGSLQVGGLVRNQSSIESLQDGRVTGSRSDSNAGLLINDSTIAVTSMEFSDNTGGGLTLSNGATGTLSDLVVNANGGDGIAAHTGAQVDVSGSTITANGAHGVLTTGQGTALTIRDSTVSDNAQRGVNAGGASTITCENVTLEGNGEGATFGNTTGC